MSDGNRLKKSDKVCVYSSWRSSCSYRVRICLNLKKVEYEIKPIDLMNLLKPGDKAGSEVYKINPMRYIPALEIDGHTLIESLAIMHYLEETRPEQQLMPKDPLKRAQTRAVCEIIASGIQPLQNVGVLNFMGDAMGENEKLWAQHWISKGFKGLETLLADISGKYCVGDEISLADCCLVPQVFNARRYEVPLEPYPTILRIDCDLQSHPAFRRAHPSMQPDFPSD